MQKPIVSDYLGYLYNKEDIIQYLLDKKRGNEVKGLEDVEISSLNDFVELKIDLCPEEGTLKCLVSDLKVNINDDSKVGLRDVMFSYIVPCGCVMNTKMLHSLINSSGEDDDVNSELKCPACSTKFRAVDIIDINNLDEKVKEKLDKRMKRLRDDGQYHNLKKVKMKKRKRKEINDKIDDDEKVKEAEMTESKLESESSYKKRKL